MKKNAVLKEKITGREIEVHATLNHPQSSYGHPIWVDEEGVAYMEVDSIIPNPFYEVVKTWEEQ